MAAIAIAHMDGLIVFAVILFLVIMALVAPWYIRSSERKVRGWRAFDVFEHFLDFFGLFR